jgi:hypothetical protein
MIIPKNDRKLDERETETDNFFANTHERDLDKEIEQLMFDKQRILRQPIEN